MHSRSKSFRPSSKLFRISDIASGLHNINFPTSRPLPIFIMLGKHPDSRPEPISFGKFCSYLNSTIFDIKGINSCKFATHNWVYVVVSIWCSLAAIKVISSALICRITSPYIIIRSSSDSITPDFVFGQYGFDIQYSIFDKGGATVVVIELEFPVTSSG